ncbi:glycerol-3-phosphate dehydrogenase subunit GlpB [Photobacterium chitinilyticum]|uniref:Anaerobic glycerol-3-phosphate dehydrogenase subunit B n=1 Tax=Photobacterium chitinilyticum TaxID=2485123 RepID=A0A444JV41_9GAMM|nr:glycerol-3-phosphate dehydrogenase subunit GlpB [Photobacterium chitinilyticum]RWX56992.1 glycerol-3-phosphate dehydrogenase subunit GlpB [Photobacterium chitinilyticum]
MKFDSIIIGGGVAGLSCAIRCAEAGLKTTVIAAGQSALHFSSGSIDVLSRLPDGQPVANPFEAFNSLKSQSPEHPYSKLGEQATRDALAWYQAMMDERGVYLTAQNDDSNHLRVTPMGTFRSTWLSQQTVHQFPLSDVAQGLDAVALVTIDGFRDFQPKLAADNLAKLPQFKGVTIKTAAVELPDFDTMQRNPCEFRSIDLSRVLRDETKLHAFAKSMIHQVGKVDLVILPAIFGNGDGAATIKLLEGLTGYKICEIPTMPPSLLGIRLEEAMKSHFKALGGLILAGDEVRRGDFENGELKRIYTKNHLDMPLIADHFLIASGSFFSRGMSAQRHSIEEPIFGLDMTDLPHRDHWYQPEFFAKQSHPFLKMGVTCNSQLQPSLHNQTISNLYCAGALLAHYDPVFEGCGSGVAISTGHYVAEQMIKAQRQTTDDKQQERTFA